MKSIKTAGQNIKFSYSMGGTVRVFEENVKLLVGGFDVDLEELPEAGEVIPAGTPIFCDEAKRTASIGYAFRVADKATSATSVKVKKIMGSSIAKVGMYLMTAPSALDTTGTASKITKIDSSNEDYDVLTLSAAITAEVDAVLVECDSEGNIKVKPNALLYCDICLDEGAQSCLVDGVYEGIVLERRTIPAIPAVQANMPRITFSNRK